MTTNGLPPNWTRVQLRELIDGFEAGRNLRAHGRPAADDEYGVLKVSAVSWGRFQPTENKALLPGDVPRSREFVRQGDLLISRANTTELVGAVVRVEGEHPRLMLPDKILRLCVRERITDPTFLMFALRLPSVRTHFEANATGTSDSMRNLSQPKIESAPVLLPPLNEQRRIVAKLEALQARSRRAREALDTVPALLEKLRQSILAAAFRGDLTKDWRAQHKDVEPASELLKRIRSERRRRWEESELAKLKAKGKPPTDDKWKAKYKEPDPVDTSGLPELPKGWCWASVEEVCDEVFLGLTSKVDYVTSGGVPLVRAGDIRSGLLSFADARCISEEQHAELTRYRRARRGDVLVSKSGSLGVCALVDTDRSFSIYESIIVMQPVRACIRSDFLLWALREPAMQKRMLGEQVGSTVGHINLADFRRIPCVLVPLSEQLAIALLIERAMSRYSRAVNALLGAIHEEARLNAAFLAKAFRGELVPQDPNDEPADAMLARLARAGESGASA